MRHIFLPAAVLFVFMALVPVRSLAQDGEIDSLKNLLLDKKLHDTTRLEIIGSIIGSSRAGDSTSVHYNQLAGEIIFRNLAKQNLDPDLRDAYYYYLAYWYCDKAIELFTPANGRKVLEYYDKAIVLFRRLDKDIEVSHTLINKGNMLRKMGAREEAIACFFEARKYLEAAGDEMGVAATNTSLAQIHEDHRDFDKALARYKEALATYTASEDTSPQHMYETAVILHNIGFVYFNQKKYTEAESYLRRGLAISREYGFSDNAAFNARSMGEIYLAQQKYEEALRMFEEGLHYAGSIRASATLQLSLGDLYLEKGAYAQAKDHVNEALALIRENQDLGLLEMAYESGYRISKAQGNFREALSMYESYIETRDGANEEASKNALVEQQLQYDFEKRELLARVKQEKEISELNAATERKIFRRNLLLGVSIAVALLLLAFLYYYFRQKNLRNAAKNNELKQKLLLSQMNPHFVFNSIDNIQSLIYNGQDGEAITYLTRFSRLTRQILENSRENFILLSEEIAMLENYLTLQKLLYNNPFTYEITLGEGIDPEELLVPPMLAQPFIENAVRHGLKEKPEGGVIRLNYEMEDKRLLFAVSDNGSGLRAHTDGHRSLSTSITEERLVTIAKRKLDVHVENITGSDGSVLGVRSHFEIPYELNY